MTDFADVYIKIYNDGRLPEYASDYSAGCDLYAVSDMAIRPGETKIMPLNFDMAICTDMEAQIRPRSGLSLKTALRISNSPGTVDSDYRDEVGVILQNTYNISDLAYQIVQDPQILKILIRDYKEVKLKDYLVLQGKDIPAGSGILHIMDNMIYIDEMNNPYGTIYIKKGERIAQMIFSRYVRANFRHHPDPREIGEDRGGGFGHTGLK